MKHVFADREAAANEILPLLEKYKHSNSAIVLGLPRGGVVVAAKLAEALSLPLDVVVLKKVTSPNNDEFAVGAVTEDGESFFDWTSGEEFCGSRKEFDAAVEKKRAEARARAARYRAIVPMQDLHGKAAILADDGIATGSTMRAAVKAARRRGARTIVVAVPVSPGDSLAQIRGEVDEIACPNVVEFFAAVGQCYKTFPQIEDKEVEAILRKFSALHP